jgi:hypothetical protein
VVLFLVIVTLFLVFFSIATPLSHSSTLSLAAFHRVFLSGAKNEGGREGGREGGKAS